MATMPLGTWVAADILGGGLVCVVPSGCPVLLPGRGLFRSWLFGLVFPIWFVALSSSSEDIVSPRESH